MGVLEERRSLLAMPVAPCCWAAVLQASSLVLDSVEDLSISLMALQAQIM